MLDKEKYIDFLNWYVKTVCEIFEENVPENKIDQAYSVSFNIPDSNNQGSVVVSPNAIRKTFMLSYECVRKGRDLNVKSYIGEFKTRQEVIAKLRSDGMVDMLAKGFLELSKSVDEKMEDYPFYPD